jgi:predicted alpha/beta-fold hydrolase
MYINIHILNNLNPNMPFKKIQLNKWFKFNHETLRRMKIFKMDLKKILKFSLSISSLSLFSYLAYTQIPFKDTNRIICQQNSINMKIQNMLGEMNYTPTLYMPSCLMQMIYNESKSSPNIQYKRQYIATHDEGAISLDWVETNSNEFKNLLVILHGLTGGSESSYIKEICNEFSKDPNYKIVVVNYRGVSGSPLLTPFIYHAGYTEDLKTAIQYLREKFPNKQCYALGTSMGANIFTRLLVRDQVTSNYIKGFVSVSNPLSCYEVEKRNRGGILDYFIIKRQIKYLTKHKHVLSQIIGNITILTIRL